MSATTVRLPSRRYACSRRCAERVRPERRRVRHEQRACEFCGEGFVPGRSDARYCGDRCRKAAHRQRRRG
jgi:hypothetical protein